MAKKKKVEEVVEEPLVEETVVMEAPEPEPVYEPVPEPVLEEPAKEKWEVCLLYTSPSPRDVEESRMPSSA